MVEDIDVSDQFLHDGVNITGQIEMIKTTETCFYIKFKKTQSILVMYHGIGTGILSGIYNNCHKLMDYRQV